MPRLREIPPEEVEDDYIKGLYQLVFNGKNPTENEKTITGTPGNWWTIFAQCPDAFKHISAGFGFYRSSSRQLSPHLRELGQVRAGYNIQSQFVYSQHMKAARFSGLSTEQVDSIANWQIANCYDASERAVLAYCDALTLENGRVSDILFAELKSHLNEVEIIEFTYIVTTYMMHGVMSKALRLEFDDIDERITEVESPVALTAAMLGIADLNKKDE